MATDLPISGLPVVTTVNATDLATLVRPGDPAGTKNKQITFDNLTASISALGWGGTRVEGGAGGIGLLHTISANAASGTQSFKTVLDNSQTNNLIAHEIDLGTSSRSHTGLLIKTDGSSLNSKGIDLNLGDAAGIGINIDNTATIGFTGIKIRANSTDSGDVGYFYTEENANPGGIAFKSSVVASDCYRHTIFSGEHTSSGATNNMTINPFLVSVNRGVSSAVAITDNFEVATFIRFNRTFSHPSPSLIANGAVVRISNVNLQSTGTLTDNVKVLQIEQGSLGNGVPVSITQNAVISTNFRKLLTEENSGASIWVSDGTSPDTNLSGTTGDICFNGDSGNLYHCTGGTSWSV